MTTTIGTRLAGYTDLLLKEDGRCVENCAMMFPTIEAVTHTYPVGRAARHKPD